MSLQTFNLEERVFELQRTASSTIFDNFVRLLHESKIKVNDALMQMKTADTAQAYQDSAKEIAKFILEKLPDQGYLNQYGLGRVIIDVFENYSNIHGLDKTRKVTLTDNETGEEHRLLQITHPIMVSIMPALANQVFPNFKTESKGLLAKNIVPSLYHDIPEDIEKKNIGKARKSISDIVNLAESLFWSSFSLDAQNAERNYLKKILTNVTHFSRQTYEKYILNLFFKGRLLNPIWQPEDILYGGLYLKSSDGLHNGINQGKVRRLTEQDDTLYGNLGLNNETRMKSFLKSFTLLNPTTQFFDIKAKNGEIDSDYSSLFDLFFIDHAVTKYNLNKLKKGTRSLYRKQPKVLEILNQLNTSMKKYSKTPKILEITDLEQDIQYYLDNGIDFTIFDGSLGVIAKRVEKMGEPLYTNITEAYHLVKLYVHTLALKNVLEQTFKNPSEGLNYVRGFANIPPELSE